MPSTSIKLDQLAAWGQYMHWAHLNFERFSTMDNGLAEAEKIGFAAHWLASEHVVLEGWSTLGLKSGRISRLLAAYPEYSDLLRRCRNAVYHFQDRALDARFSTFMKDENEELSWAAALHFEFQGYLMEFTAAAASKSDDPDEALEGIARLIGWFPAHPYADQLRSAYALAAESATKTAGSQSDAANELRQAARDVLAVVHSLDCFPLSSALQRMQPSTPDGTSGA